MKIGITCYPTYGGSGVVATELGLELAQRGHEIHFISYAQPIRLRGEEPNIHYHEVEVSRYPLFDYPPYDLALATRMAEVAQLYDLDLLHVHYAIPALGERHAGSADARRRTPRTPPALRHHFARNRHHAGRSRPLVPADHPLLHPAKRRRHGHLELSARPHATRLRREEQHRSDLQLRQLRCLLPQLRNRRQAARRVRAQQRTHSGASLELPSGKAPHRRDRDFRPRAQKDAIQASADRRWPRPLRR